MVLGVLNKLSVKSSYKAISEALALYVIFGTLSCSCKVLSTCEEGVPLFRENSSLGIGS